MQLSRFAVVCALGLVGSFAACGNSAPSPGFADDADGGIADAASLDESSPLVGSDAPLAGTDGSPVEVPINPQTCAEATQAKTYVGCDYWPTVVANSVWSVFDFAVVVANTANSTATITVT